MKQDVCYWINHELEGRGSRIACLNTAVEATTLTDRSCGSLLAQDCFIRDNIGPDDYLVVSVGGNDIALRPLLCTILNIVPLVCCAPAVTLDNCACACPPNTRIDLGCAGCGICGCLAGTVCGFPLGLGYFVDLFKNQVENYVKRILGKRRPRKVLVCMIYYPGVASEPSWADGALGALGYNACPDRLQRLIRTVFELGTKRISIPGTEVVAVPLFRVLDPAERGDYLQRVEPSVQGGHKMAKTFVDLVIGEPAPSFAPAAVITPATEECIPLSARE